MNKKVLSAILFSALFACTGTFTSCIDNDEPEGIENLRGAKAELLRAKVAVEQANAAFKLAQAEVQKAEAARLESLAKINEASARLEEARAEAAEIQNDADRATLEKTIAEYEMYLEEAAAKHEMTMVTTQKELAVAKRNYELALKAIEIAEAVMSEKDLLFVSDLKKTVNNCLAKVEGLEHDIEKQQDKVYEAAKYIGAETKFQISQAEIALNNQKATLEAKELAIEKYKKYLELDSTATESDWRNEIAEIEAEIAEYDKKMAEFQLELVKNKESEETKALEKAVKDAEAAKAAIKAPKGTEDLSYTYLYWAGEQNKKIVVPAKDKDLVGVGDAIAGDGFEEAEEYGAGIEALNKEIAKYTTEYKYWLDSIADMASTGAVAAETNAKALKKAWSDAKTAYEAALAATAINYDAIWKSDGTGAYPTFKKAKEDAEALSGDERTKAILKAEQTFADALVTFYNGLPAAQVTLSNISLPVTVGSGASATEVLQTKTVKEWLSDATNKDVYLNQIYSYFGTWQALWKFTDGDKNEVLNEGGKTIKTKSNSAFTKWTTKEALVEDTKAKLLTASNNAFGPATQYANNAPAGTDGWYLHNEPTLEDFKYVKANVASANVGGYGNWMLSKDIETAYVAKNYEAILTDYKAAIEYWTAAVDDIKEALTEYEADVEAAQDVIDAAQKAFDDHKKAFVDAFNNAVVGLKEKIESLKNVKWALINVVDEYLAENYTGEGSFMTYLANELKKAEEAIPALVLAVEKAEVDLEAAKEGKFFTAQKVKKEQELLAKLEEDLAQALEELEKALADLATAESIWAGTAE